MSVLNWEFTYDVTALDHYRRLASPRSPRRYAFWLLGALLVWLVLCLVHPAGTGRVRALPTAINLVLNPLTPPMQPDIAIENPPAPAEPALIDADSSRQHPVNADSLKAQAVPPEPAIPSVNLTEARAMLMQQYQSQLVDQVPSVTPTGATVMDAALLQRLNALPAAQLHTNEWTSTLPDALGETRVQLGDHCFVTTDLDNQAMRGMKNWWVGLCGTDPKPSISLDGVKVLGAP